MRAEISPRLIIAKGKLALSVVLVYWLACHAAGRAADKTNVVLLTIDTLRADHVSSLAPHSPAATPALDALAKDGVVFTNTVTTNPLTLPAHASLMTGLWPFAHGVRDFTGYRLDESHHTLAESLSRAGYECAAFVSAAVLDHRTGMAQGFKIYNDDFDGFLGGAARVAERGGETTLQLARQWLALRRDKPFFLWVHLFEPHDPYTPPEPFRSQYAAQLYAGEVAYVDSLLGPFWQELKKEGLYEPSLIAVLSDHGEGLGEHGESRHGFFVYQSTMRVPWILKMPSGAFAGKRIDANVTVIDFFPTLLQILKFNRTDWPSSLQGKGRYGLMGRESGKTEGGSARPELIYMESQTPRNQYGWSDLRALQLGRLKMIEAPDRELYDLEQDPNELINLAKGNGSLVLKLREALARFEARFQMRQADAEAIDPELEERLRSLGYVGISGAVAGPKAGERLADPKAKIAVWEQAQRGVEAAREQNWPMAIRELETVARAEPQSPAIAASLALVYRDAGQPEKSLFWFDRVLQLQPEDSSLRLQLARYVLILGRTEEARSQFQTILSRDPNHFLALFNLGTLLARQSELEAAIVYFKKALTIKEDLEVLRSLALAEMYSGRWMEAERHLLRALDLKPNDPPTTQQLKELRERKSKRTKEH